MSANEQFNQHYLDAIDTIKSRALWRVGERITEGETFRATCPNCGYESLHQRFDVTRHRLLFGRSIRQMEAPIPMVRCRRCSDQRHLRDIGEFVVPSTIALADDVRAAVGSPSGDDLHTALLAFREQASGPVRRMLAAELIADGGLDSDQIATLREDLALTADEISALMSGSGRADDRSE